MAYRFTVDFDAEEGVWYVRDSTLPGLRTEAQSLDALVGKLQVMVPDLLAAIGEVGLPQHHGLNPPFRLTS